MIHPASTLVAVSALLVVGCAGSPEDAERNYDNYAIVNGFWVKCRRVAPLGSRIRTDLECGSGADPAGVAAYGEWRSKRRKLEVPAWQSGWTTRGTSSPGIAVRR